jgi:hypothetical protein
MTHKRKSELVRLAFEKKLTRDIDFDAFVLNFKLCIDGSRLIAL